MFLQILSMNMGEIYNVHINNTALDIQELVLLEQDH